MYTDEVPHTCAHAPRPEPTLKTHKTSEYVKPWPLATPHRGPNRHSGYGRGPTKAQNHSNIMLTFTWSPPHALTGCVPKSFGAAWSLPACASDAWAAHRRKTEPQHRSCSDSK
jgi:hypothetical protein